MQKIKQLQGEVQYNHNGWSVAGKKVLEQRRDLDKFYADNAQLHAAAHRAGLELQGEASHSNSISR